MNSTYLAIAIVVVGALSALLSQVDWGALGARKAEEEAERRRWRQRDAEAEAEQRSKEGQP
jgi:hypothetical protein